MPKEWMLENARFATLYDKSAKVEKIHRCSKEHQKRVKEINPKDYRCLACNKEFKEGAGWISSVEQLKRHLKSEEHKKKMTQLSDGSYVLTTLSLHQRYFVAMAVIQGRIMVSQLVMRIVQSSNEDAKYLKQTMLLAANRIEAVAELVDQVNERAELSEKLDDLEDPHLG